MTLAQWQYDADSGWLSADMGPYLGSGTPAIPPGGNYTPMPPYTYAVGWIVASPLPSGLPDLTNKMYSEIYIDGPGQSGAVGSAPTDPHLFVTVAEPNYAEWAAPYAPEKVTPVEYSALGTASLTAFDFPAPLPYPNDNFANATEMPSVYPTSVTQEVDFMYRFGTFEVGESPIASWYEHATIWFKWVCPAGGFYALDAYGSTIPYTGYIEDGLDVEFYCYRQDGTGFEGLVLVGEGHDDGDYDANPATGWYEPGTAITFDTGATYYIQVLPYWIGVAGTLVLSVSDGPPPPFDYVSMTSDAVGGIVVPGETTFTLTGLRMDLVQEVWAADINGTALQLVPFAPIDSENISLPVPASLPIDTRCWALRQGNIWETTATFTIAFPADPIETPPPRPIEPYIEPTAEWSDWEYLAGGARDFGYSGATAHLERVTAYPYLSEPYFSNHLPGQTIAQIDAIKSPNDYTTSDNGTQTAVVDIPLLVVDLNAFAYSDGIDHTLVQPEYGSNGIDIHFDNAAFSAVLYDGVADQALVEQFDGAKLVFVYAMQDDVFEYSPGRYRFRGEVFAKDFLAYEVAGEFTYNWSSASWQPVASGGGGQKYLDTEGLQLPSTLHIPAEKVRFGPAYIAAYFLLPNGTMRFDRRRYNYAPGTEPYIPEIMVSLDYAFNTNAGSLLFHWRDGVVLTNTIGATVTGGKRPGERFSLYVDTGPVAQVLHRVGWRLIDRNTLSPVAWFTNQTYYYAPTTDRILYAMMWPEQRNTLVRQMSLYLNLANCTFASSGFSRRVRSLRPGAREGTLAIVHEEMWSPDQNVRPDIVAKLTGGTSVALTLDYGTGNLLTSRKIGFHTQGPTFAIPEADITMSNGAVAVYRSLADRGVYVGNGEYHIPSLNTAVVSGTYVDHEILIYRFRREGGDTVYKGVIRAGVLPNTAEYMYSLVSAGPNRFLMANGYNSNKLGLLSYVEGAWQIEQPVSPVDEYELPGRPIDNALSWQSPWTIGGIVWLSGDRFLLQIHVYYGTGTAFSDYNQMYAAAAFVIRSGYMTVERTSPGVWRILDVYVDTDRWYTP